MEHKSTTVSRFAINEIHGHVERKPNYFRIVAFKKNKTYECFVGKRRIRMEHCALSQELVDTIIEETEQLLHSKSVERCVKDETDEIIVLRFTMEMKSGMRSKCFKLLRNKKKDPAENMLVQILDKGAKKISIGGSKEYGNYLCFSDISSNDFTENEKTFAYTGSNKYYKILRITNINRKRILRDCLCIMSSWINIGGKFFDLTRYVDKIIELFSMVGGYTEDDTHIRYYEKKSEGKYECCGDHLPMTNSIISNNAKSAFDVYRKYLEKKNKECIIYVTFDFLNCVIHIKLSGDLINLKVISYSQFGDLKEVIDCFSEIFLGNVSRKNNIDVEPCAIFALLTKYVSESNICFVILRYIYNRIVGE